MNQYKTVLAPNIPWPKAMEKETNQKRKVRTKIVRIAKENDSLDYFLQTHEELNKSKVAIQSRVRDVSTGRLKGSKRMAG